MALGPRVSVDTQLVGKFLWFLYFLGKKKKKKKKTMYTIITRQLLQ